MSLKVYIAGPPRTGTSTLAEALRQAGLNAAHGREPVSNRPLALLIEQAFTEKRDPLYYVSRGVDAVADTHLTRSPKWGKVTAWPTFETGFWEALRKHNPACKVILPLREPGSWIDSLNRWKDLRERIVRSDLPGLPKDKGAEDKELADWLLDYQQRVILTFAGDPNFMAFELGCKDERRELEAFLGFKLPWWGVKNRGPASKGASFKL